MRFHHAIIATLAVFGALPATQAFTQGELLLPSYLCGPAQANADGTLTGLDGKPKALGRVLLGLQEYTYAHSKEVNLDNDYFYDPINDPMIFLAAMHNAHAAGLSAQFHGAGRVPVPPKGLNTLTPPGNINPDAVNPYNNITVPIAPQTNAMGVIGIPAVPADVTNAAGEVTAGNMVAPDPATQFTQITPNAPVTLSLQAKNNPPPGMLGVFDPANGADIALDGAIVYAQAVVNNKPLRVGKFIQGGENAAPWNACGPDNNGIVHTQLLSDTNVYNGPTFFLPATFLWPGSATANVRQITFMGATVSDGGFGYHQTVWSVKPLDPLQINAAALSMADRNQCRQNNIVCLASCFDCANQAGSKAAAAGAKAVSVLGAAGKAAFSCKPNLATGNPAMKQAAVWTATCTIAGVATSVKPPGTQIQQVAAAGVGALSAEDQAQMEDIQAAYVAVAAGTTADNTQCPTNKNPNTAYTTSISWLSTIALAFTGVLAARR